MSDDGESTDRDVLEDGDGVTPVPEGVTEAPAATGDAASDEDCEPAQEIAPDEAPVVIGSHSALDETPAETPDETAPEESAPSQDAETPAPEATVPEAPTPAPAELPAIVVAPEPGRALGDRLPFWILGGVWVAFVAALVYLLWPESAGVFVTSDLYAVFVFGGAGLVVVGFVTGLVTWLLARGRARKDERGHIARAVWIRAMAWTAGGVALWWIGLVVLDLHRSGLIR